MIELLVVIAIIAILAALLFPSLAAARDKARAVHCLSNEKQLAAAFMTYAQDWDGVLPRIWTMDGGPIQPAGSSEPYFLGLPWGERDWATDTYRYVGNPGAYRCPSKDLYRGYGFNAWLAPAEGFALDDIAFPTRTCLFAEITGIHGATDPYAFVDRSAPENWPVDDRFWFEPRHQGGANVGFADGHAHWVKSSVYTQWPAPPPEDGYPDGTYWWPTATSPPG